MFEEEMARRGPALAGQLSALRLDEVDEDSLIGALAATELLARWAAAAQLAVISELASRRGDPQYVEDEVAAELRLSRVAASARLGLALDLDRLPALSAGMAAGHLDLPKAKAIADAVRVLDPAVGQAVADEAVERSTRQTVGELRAWLRRKVLAADPGAAEARHAQAVADRRVTLTPVGDGMAELWALLAADEAARAYAAINACAAASASGDAAADHSGPSDDRADDRSEPREAEDPQTSRGDVRTADQRRADAMVDLLTGQAAAPRAIVQVTVPLSTLVAGGDEPGELAGVGPIPATMARRLAADGVWRWLATTDGGTVAAASPRTYRPGAALAALVRGRDRTCRFPGCRQPAYRCDLDHTVPYPTGPTAAANLAALCRHHHRLKHQTGWSVVQHPDARLTWTSPAGRVYTTSPPQHRSRPAPPEVPETAAANLDAANPEAASQQAPDAMDPGQEGPAQDGLGADAIDPEAA